MSFASAVLLVALALLVLLGISGLILAVIWWIANTVASRIGDDEPYEYEHDALYVIREDR